MARSVRFRELQVRATELRLHLLPRTDPTGSYTARQYDRVRAFRLLAHAEIEACLEDLAVAAATRCYSDWCTDGRPRTVLLALAAYHDRQFPAIPASTTVVPSDSLDMRIETAKNDYCTRIIGRNNGIRERNVLGILLPVGVAAADFDPGWLATIDSFGSQRGDTAHRAGRTQQPPDPVSEADTVHQIIEGIRTVDARLEELVTE
jgi:hypothetical protein